MELDKLPKWAKSEIESLQRENEYLEKRLSEYAGEKESNVKVQDGLKYTPLPKNSHVKFITGAFNENSVTVYIRDNNVIDINCTNNDPMVIVPRASNSFYISFTKLP